MPKKLYIGNLSYEVTDEDLTQLFSQCGQVSEAKVMKDRDSGRSKGFGFVEMPNNDEATHAIDRMKGYDLKGRQITVDEAKERAPGAVGSGSGGGSGFDRHGERNNDKGGRGSGGRGRR